MNRERYQHIFIMLREEIKSNDSVEWFTFKQMSQDVEVMIANGMMSYVHEQMQNFYEEYLWKTFESHKAWSFIDFVAHRDDFFGEWATGKIDLMKLTEAWIERDDSRTLLSLLSRLGQTGYETNWQVLRALLDEKLRRMEVEGTRNGVKETGYFYCLLHAFTMIMMSEQSLEDKMRLLEQFSRQWAFLRTVYSVMVRRIVGLNYTNFAQLAQYVVGGQQDFDPFLHLFHAPLKERFEELVELGTKRESLTRALDKIEKRMNNTQQSADLDVLCEVLFPEEFCNMLNMHRMPSYHELESEIDRIRVELDSTQETMNRQAQEMAVQLSAAVNASVPIDVIEQRLLIFPSGTALSVYMPLNTMLQVNPAWQAHSESILQKILAKQQQELQLSMNITAQPGSNVNGIVQQQMNNNILPNKQISA
ncbi:hypothetical protein [Xylanibacter brevis]|uniref:hypothetical protein n=1 Tax=Xylanibacter brevis TaxID=83231 RepID=UPI000ACF7ED2|nr:hypothetical protein [Xylanibacter brevis]